MNEYIKQAVSELQHALDAGEDYNKSIQWISQRNFISVEEIENSYNSYLLQIE